MLYMAMYLIVNYEKPFENILIEKHNNEIEIENIFPWHVGNLHE